VPQPIRETARRQAPRHARGLDPFDSAQGHPEPACGERVEPVETAAALHPTASFRLSTHIL
jgi:hypothetical protein